MSIKDLDFSFCCVEGRTDPGCRRPVNEDSISRDVNGKSRGLEVTPNGGAVVVCDGMGGYAGGKVASETAVEAVLLHLHEKRYNDPREAVKNAIIAANIAVLRKAADRLELTGMGCTCVLLLVTHKGEVYVGHVGDSRIYLFRPRDAENGINPIHLLTKDQSYVQLLVDQKVITERDALDHPRSNEITNAVGMKNMTPPVVRDQPIVPQVGDCFLLCSDGLHKVVPESEIFRIVCNKPLGFDRGKGSELCLPDNKNESPCTLSLARRVELLVETARKYGGPDNISAQVVEFSVSPEVVYDALKKKRMLKYTILVVIAIAAAAVLVTALLKCCKKTPAPEESSKQIKSADSLNYYPEKSDTLNLEDIMLEGNDEMEHMNQNPAQIGPFTNQNQEQDPSPSDSDQNPAQNGPFTNQNQEQDPSPSDSTQNQVTYYYFPASEKSLDIKVSNCKLTKPDPPKGDYRSGSVIFKINNDGSLTINKVGNIKSWKGFKITINKYRKMADGKCVGQPQLFHKPIIVEFE